MPTFLPLVVTFVSKLDFPKVLRDLLWSLLLRRDEGSGLVLLLERFPSLDFLLNESCELFIVLVVVAVSERPVKVRLGHCLHLLAASSLGKWLSRARRLISQK